MVWTSQATSRIVPEVTGDEVRRLRRRLNLTQQAFGELVGVAANSVARWEREEMAIRESAVKLMQLGQIDVKPVISHTLPLAEATRAFELAGGRA